MTECPHTDAIQRLLTGTYDVGDILVVSMLDMLDIVDALRAEVTKHSERKPQSLLADIRRVHAARNGNSTAQRAQAKAKA